MGIGHGTVVAGLLKVFASQYIALTRLVDISSEDGTVRLFSPFLEGVDDRCQPNEMGKVENGQADFLN